jgi:hypothetical protein
MRIIPVLLLALLAACGNPLDVPLPKDAARADIFGRNIDKLAPHIDRLSPEDRAMFATYMTRYMADERTARPARDIPAGMTIGKAIAEERARATGSKN